MKPPHEGVHVAGEDQVAGRPLGYRGDDGGPLVAVAVPVVHVDVGPRRAGEHRARTGSCSGCPAPARWPCWSGSPWSANGLLLAECRRPRASSPSAPCAAGWTTHGGSWSASLRTWASHAALPTMLISRLDGTTSTRCRQGRISRQLSPRAGVDEIGACLSLLDPFGTTVRLHEPPDGEAGEPRLDARQPLLVVPWHDKRGRTTIRHRSGRGSPEGGPALPGPGGGRPAPGGGRAW